MQELKELAKRSEGQIQIELRLENAFLKYQGSAEDLPLVTASLQSDRTASFWQAWCYRAIALLILETIALVWTALA